MDRAAYLADATAEMHPTQRSRLLNGPRPGDVAASEEISLNRFPRDARVEGVRLIEDHGRGAEMRSTRMLSIAAAAVSGALLLSGCGDKAPTASAPAPESSAAAGGAAGSDQTVADSTQLQNGTAKTSKANPGTGDWAAPEGGVLDEAKMIEAEKWVQLTATRLEGLGEVLVNGAGLTLYRFDEDEAKPSKATCNGECATTWPPVTVKAGGKVFIAGVDKKDVGFVKRDDGKLQVTVGGWPVYRFAKDTKAGDTKGQGVGDTWFGVRPDGGRSGAGKNGAGQDAAEETPEIEESTPPAQGKQGQGEQGEGEQGQGEQGQGEQGEGEQGQGEQGQGEQENTPAKRVVLFSGFSFNVFDDEAASQVIEADTVPDGGCVNAIDAKTASSIAFDGLVKIWSGPDCTGESKELGAVNAENVGGIADLRDIDFNNKIASVKVLS
ncbi:hypothetical protein [Actinoplanes sp. NPDC051494]|uniref:hypothetical protein n=1 Tax=Actinoplanes sp. NPDC051494 TaxID=3363907 RepID=UPI0037B49EAF